MLHNKELLKDCYKVSIDTSLVDTACIPDVGNNGFKTVKATATPPSTIQMNVENKTAPKLHTKRKNVYVSSDEMQRQAKKKSLQKLSQPRKVKRIFRYLRGTVNMGLWYTKDSGFELTEFSNADYVGCKDTFKSTSDGAQFLSEKLTQLTDYGFYFNKIPIYCDSKSAIAISCNLVQHSRTKHIVVRYHFIKEHMEKGTIELYFVKTDYQLADLFTKALLVDRFYYLVRRLGLRRLSPQELDRLVKLQ
ncbi:hypothetical protein Tco_1123025 [Tanacetum coccineum]|uniref:Retrovirus-related Pol polyprotein from transposon TNT 1-94 n=1 Tax=Tanacetum coccineum TaxID=301880 RepID=A0ABQ5J3L1_9ASTR